MASTTRLMTVEEFRELPEATGEFDYELRHGESIQVSRPKAKHHSVQTKLVRMLEEAIPSPAYVSMEVPFRPLPEHELWAADVAVVEHKRWREALDRGDLFGAPDLVIEVLSPSNSASEMYERERLCLENGCREFWVVDLERRRVIVISRHEPARYYGDGGQIPLAAFGGGSIRVDSVFAI